MGKTKASTVSSGRIAENNYFQAKVGKDLPEQFPEPLSVGQMDGGNFALSNTANTLQAGKYLKYFQRGSKSAIYYRTHY